MNTIVEKITPAPQTVDTDENSRSMQAAALKRIWNNAEEAILELSRPLLAEAQEYAEYRFRMTGSQKAILQLSERLLREKKIAYGLTLLAARIAAWGITREELSKKTSIPAEKLEQIESGAVEMSKEERYTIASCLPSSVVILESIAENFFAIGLSDDELVTDLRTKISETNPSGTDLFNLFKNHLSWKGVSITGDPGFDLFTIHLRSKMSKKEEGDDATVVTLEKL